MSQDWNNKTSTINANTAVINTDYPPSAAGIAGNLLYNRADATLYANIDTTGNPAGTGRVWSPVSGLNSQYPKYFVSTAAGPPCPYSEIQAAIDAAVADGHDEADPAIIMVYPGSYSAITIPPGISIFGIAQSFLSSFPAVIVSGITVTASSVINTGIYGVYSTGLFSMSGASDVYVSIHSCYFESGLVIFCSGQVSIFAENSLISNSSAGAVTSIINPANGSTFYSRNSSFSGTPSGLNDAVISFAGMSGNTGWSLFFFNSFITSTDATKDSFYGSVNRLTIENTSVTGRIFVPLGASTSVNITNSTLSASGVAVLSTQSGTTTSSITNSKITTDVSPAIAGTGGTVNIFGSNTFTNKFSKSTAVTMAARGSMVPLPQRSLSGAGPHAITEEDSLLLIDTGNTAGIVASLPDARTVWTTKQFVFVNTNSGATGTIVLTPSGAQTINGGASFTMANGGAGYQRNTIVSTGSAWIVIG